MADDEWAGLAGGVGSDTDSEIDESCDAATPAAAASSSSSSTAAAAAASAQAGKTNVASLSSDSIASWLEDWGDRSSDDALAAQSHRFLRTQILALAKRIEAHAAVHRANQAARRYARDLERQRVGTEWMPQPNGAPAQAPVPRAATMMLTDSSSSSPQALLAAPASSSSTSTAASSDAVSSSDLTAAESAALAAAPLEPIVSVSESSAPSGYILSAAALARRARKESGAYQAQKEKQQQQRLAKEKQQGKPALLTTGASTAASAGAAAAAAPSLPSKTQTHSETRTVRQLKHLAAHRCYVCKLPLTGEAAVDRHAIFTNHCASCGEANNTKRDRLVDLKGKIAVLTGARIKIGYQIGLRLLRCGATLLATSRFPANALCRYQQEADYSSWAANLHLLYADLCNPSEVTALAARIASMVTHVDIVINNAAQTVRRPLPYYANLNRIELASQQRLLSIAEQTHTTFRIEAHPDVGKHPRSLVEGAAGAAAAAPSATAAGPDAATAAAAAVTPAAVIHAADLPAVPLASSIASPVPSVAAAQFAARAEPIHAATATFSSSSSSALSASPPPAASSVPALNSLIVAGAGRIELPATLSHTPFSVIPSLDCYSASDAARLFPPGKVDTTNDCEPLDLRAANSWSQKAEEVDPRELAEVLSTNAMAPFVLSTALKPLLLKSPSAHRFLILVSSMEGKLNRSKTDMHAHTNMAKAALNAFTRTVAAEWAIQRIYINSVDTGWNSEERAVNDPRREANFETPLDCADGAARVLDPIFEAEEHNRIIFGQFLKDYTPTDW